MNTHYTATAKALHWLMAALLLGTLSVGWYMTDLALSPLKLQLYSWHKWAGVTAWWLLLLRLAGVGWVAGCLATQHKPTELCWVTFVTQPTFWHEIPNRLILHRMGRFFYFIHARSLRAIQRVNIPTLLKSPPNESPDECCCTANRPDG